MPQKCKSKCKLLEKAGIFLQVPAAHEEVRDLQLRLSDLEDQYPFTLCSIACLERNIAISKRMKSKVKPVAILKEQLLNTQYREKKVRADIQAVKACLSLKIGIQNCLERSKRPILEKDHYTKIVVCNCKQICKATPFGLGIPVTAPFGWEPPQGKK